MRGEAGPRGEGTLFARLLNISSEIRRRQPPRRARRRPGAGLPPLVGSDAGHACVAAGGAPGGGGGSAGGGAAPAAAASDSALGDADTPARPRLERPRPRAAPLCVAPITGTLPNTPAPYAARRSPPRPALRAEAPDLRPPPAPPPPREVVWPPRTRPAALQGLWRDGQVNVCGNTLAVCRPRPRPAPWRSRRHRGDCSGAYAGAGRRWPRGWRASRPPGGAPPRVRPPTSPTPGWRTSSCSERAPRGRAAPIGAPAARRRRRGARACAAAAAAVKPLPARARSRARARACRPTPAHRIQFMPPPFGPILISKEAHNSVFKGARAGCGVRARQLAAARAAPAPRDPAIPAPPPPPPPPPAATAGHRALPRRSAAGRRRPFGAASPLAAAAPTAQPLPAAAARSRARVPAREQPRAVRGRAGAGGVHLGRQRAGHLRAAKRPGDGAPHGA